MRMVFVMLAVVALLGVVGARAQSSLSKPVPGDAQQLTKAQSGYKSAKDMYHRHPSPKTKQALVVATDIYAMTSMMSSILGPRTKYPQALRLYREALKLDPKNHEAKTNSDLIISIYHSMHRPVPH